MKKLIVSFLLLVSFNLQAELSIILQDTPLKDFVSWYTEETGKTVFIEPGLNSSLNVYAPEVKKEALDDFFEVLIKANNLELINENGVLSIEKKTLLPDDKTEEPAEPAEPEEIKALITTIYIFKNILADDLLDFVDGFISEKDNKTSNKTNLESVHVVRSLNALAITTTEEQQNIFNNLHHVLDTARPLIHLEAIIFEDTTATGLDLGMSYGKTSSTGDYIGGFEAGNLNTFNPSGLSFGILSNDDLRFNLNAIENNSKINILSKPKILIISGEEGIISVGQNVPFISSTTLGNGNSTQSIERRDVGVSLTVKPFITQDNVILLSLSLTADSINQTLKATDIITNTRNIKTKIRLLEGETINLGGLITQEDEEKIRKIPLLGSIPFLGALFRSTTTSTTYKELNILLTATKI